MSELKRTTSRQAAPNDAEKSQKPRDRVVVLRERIRSVRPDDGQSTASLRLAIATVAAAVSVLGIWTLGFIGFRLGVAPLFGVPDLLAEPGGGLATGVLMVLWAPMTIFRAGLHQPVALVLGFALLTLPAGLLPLVRPLVPNGPRPKPGILALNAFGAFVAIFFAGLVVSWTVWPGRLDLLAALPVSTDRISLWRNELFAIAGLDLFAALATLLWAILVLRLAIPRWLRWLSGAIVFFALGVALVSTSISNAAVTHLHTSRAVIARQETNALLLGSTREHSVLLWVNGETLQITLEPPQALVITGRQSVVEFAENGIGSAD